MPRRLLRQPNATLAALCITELLSWATLYYPYSMFVAPLQAEFGWTQPQVMGALSLGLLCMGLAAVPVGMCIDRFGGRWMMSFGSALACAGVLGWSRVTALWHLYLVWCVLGAALAMVLYEPAFAVVTRAFGAGYRRAITWLTLTGGFASTLSFPLCYALIAQLGWRDALAALAAINLAVCLPLHWFALRDTPHVHADLPADFPADEGVRTAHADSRGAFRAALRTRTFWGLALAFTCYNLVVTATWMHLIAALAERGFAEVAAVGVIAWIGPMQVGGRLVQFVFAARFNTARIGRAVFCGLPLAMLLLALMPNAMYAAFAFAFLFGAGNGVVTIVRGAAVPEFLGRAAVGALNGALTVPTAFARAAAPFAGSVLLVALGSYRGVMLALMAVALLALGAFLVATLGVRAQPQPASRESGAARKA